MHKPRLSRTKKQERAFYRADLTKSYSYAPRASNKYIRVKSRLIEAQNHRCAVCSTPIDIYAYSTDNHRACLIKIDREEPVSYANTILCCAHCGGRQANFPSVVEFYEYLQNPKPKAEKPQIEYPETIPLIHEMLGKMAPADLLPRIKVQPGFKFAPPENVESIVLALIRRTAAMTPRQSSKKKGIMLTARRRRIFSEAQNHRCCYCNHPMKLTMYDENSEGHPRLATWEHVESRRDGGENSAANLVVACFTCNSIRGTTNMTAMEFYEWAQANLAEIDRRARQMIEDRISENKRTTLTCVY